MAAIRFSLHATAPFLYNDKCQAIPEASIEALQAKLAALQGEKEELIRQHREALDAKETYVSGLKEQLIQLGLKHIEAMKTAQAAAEARLNEALEDANNSTVVLRAELEEGAKARQAAEEGLTRRWLPGKMPPQVRARCVDEVHRRRCAAPTRRPHLDRRLPSMPAGM
ncbi:hypothetical protein QYE76_060862 [Lolium multiflorum]|uniref:Uncharacterized protein n=1 Tax=Lolium multiflorum TaxID=4521 RepID=A0AAD8S045_LOLMU|nr:hypothetical protein QYE76_060862 [Lolium multiflorum]